jgi:hypothetical protein
VFFESTYQGQSNFIVELLDSNGNNIDLVVNTVGNYNGKSLAYIQSPGEYILNVQSEGSWTVQASQEIPTETESGSISGKGDDVRFVNIESGLRKFIYDYKGESNFIVMANDDVLLVNEVGTTNGSTAQSVQDTGVYVISIESEGTWKIDIE